MADEATAGWVSGTEPVDSAAIMGVLKDCLSEVLGADVVAVMPITQQTKALADLGLSSLDMLRLVEAIDQRYPVAEPLVMWIASMPIQQMGELTVGDIVGFIDDVIQ
ncbi:MAG: phosphopantetheine-binding protein [Propionibacteriaceae bacterium]|jgi:acyl carrier protein|nr:phosphopantetheine-binding protein [Propionibacteriaceae bacterium]